MELKQQSKLELQARTELDVAGNRRDRNDEPEAQANTLHKVNTGKKKKIENDLAKIEDWRGELWLTEEVD